MSRPPSTCPRPPWRCSSRGCPGRWVWPPSCWTRPRTPPPHLPRYAHRLQHRSKFKGGNESCEKCLKVEILHSSYSVIMFQESLDDDRLVSVHHTYKISDSKLNCVCCSRCCWRKCGEQPQNFSP